MVSKVKKITLKNYKNTTAKMYITYAQSWKWWNFYSRVAQSSRPLQVSVWPDLTNLLVFTSFYTFSLFSKKRWNFLSPLVLVTMDNVRLEIGIHRSDFFSSDTDAGGLRIGGYPILTQYHCWFKKLQALPSVASLHINLFLNVTLNCVVGNWYARIWNLQCPGTVRLLI